MSEKLFALLKRVRVGSAEKVTGRVEVKEQGIGIGKL